MNKKSIFILIFISVFIGKIQAQERILDIGDQLAVWLEKIQPGTESDFGFSNRNEFSMATLGKPIAVYRLNESLEGDKKNGDTGALVPTGDFRIPVLVGQESRLMVTVVHSNNGWKIVDIGARDLAREIAMACSHAVLHDTDQLYLLRIHSLTCDLLFTGDIAGLAGPLEFYPLESARVSLPELSLFSGRSVGFSDLMPVINQNQNLRSIKTTGR